MVNRWLGQIDSAVPAANQAVVDQTGNLSPTKTNGILQSQALERTQAGNPLAGIDRGAINADLSFNDGKNIAQWIFERTKPNIDFVSGVAVDKNRVQPGFSLPQMSPTGQGYQVVPDPSSPTGSRIVMPSGADDVYRRFKEIDAGVTSRSTPEKVWNPATGRYDLVTRQQVLDAAGGGQQQPQPQPAAPTIAPQPGMTGRFVGDPANVIAAINNIKDPQERANALSAFEEQARRTPGFAKAGPFAAEPSTSEATNAAADKEQAVQRAKDVAEQRKAMVNAGFNAPNNIARYQQIGQLLADVDGGKFTPAGTELASALNGFGFKLDKNLPNKEAAMALANQAALELRSPAGGAGMPGALSDADRNYLVSMTPNQAQSAQGRAQIIRDYIAVQQRNMQVAQFVRNYEKKYGKLDNGFFDQLQQWSNANPLFRTK
jgi:hypothetical protein